MWQWFSNFFVNAFVSRVKRRTPQNEDREAVVGKTKAMATPQLIHVVVPARNLLWHCQKQIPRRNRLRNDKGLGCAFANLQHCRSSLRVQLRSLHASGTLAPTSRDIPRF